MSSMLLLVLLYFEMSIDVNDSFVAVSFQEKLFPYIRDNVEKYLTEKFEDAETIKDVTALREQVSCCS